MTSERPGRPTWRAPAVGLAVLVALLVTSCRGGDSDGEDDASVGSRVTRLLLPAEAVGASSRTGMDLLSVKAALPCGPETTVVWNDAESGDFARYSGGRDTVVLGSWPVDDASERALSTLADGLAAGDCADDAGDPGTSRWGVSRLSLPGVSDVVAFSTVVRTAPGDEVAAPLSEPAGDAEERHGARAYGVVEDRGVAVWVGPSDDPVPAARVAELWRAQADRVRQERER